MSKRLLVLMCSILLVVPLLFMGCSGDDGATGATGATGSTGATGATGPPGPGVVSNEACVVCHHAGADFAVDSVHRIGASPGSVTFTIDNVVYGTPVGDNVPVTVSFHFSAKDSTGADITNKIDLRTTTKGNFGSPTDNLSYMRVSAAKLVAGTSGDSDEYSAFIMRSGPGVTGSGPYYSFASNGNNGAVVTYDNTSGAGSYRLPDNAVRLADGYQDNVPIRVGVQISGLPVGLFTSDPFLQASFRRPVANAVFDSVPNGSPVTVFKNDVTTKSSVQSCNKCHDPLAIHGGSRREYKFCQVCHNSKIETAAGGSFDNGNLVNLVHGIHNSQNIGELGDFSDVSYPQAINNCTTCHTGPDTVGNTYDNWKTKPTIRGCSAGNCHPGLNLTTGAGHVGGAQANNQACTLCHSSSAIPGYHAAKEGAPPTPNNPVLAGNLKAITYGIDNVTVDSTNAATIKFSIKVDNVLASLGDNVITQLSGFSSGPSFLFAYTLPQDGVSAPADYNNRGRAAAQPKSVPILNLPIVAKDATSYTVKVADAFPAGAQMRAVALQGYYTQTNGIGTDNVGRHTPAAQMAVNGDAIRRKVVKSGYTAAGVPEGCLECHEVFEGHGGNRVNNVQVCVMCHNPNLSTSGRTIDPAVLTSPTASDTAKAIVAKFGSDPLKYPEVTNNFKELIHGLHAAEMRVNEFQDVRGDRLALILGDEIKYPGDLSDCKKCHDGTTYMNVQVSNILWTTEKTTTGVAGETRAQIIAARASVPNDNDLVNSATASACGYCHDDPAVVGHFISTGGGDIKTTRSTATLKPLPLAPDIMPDITP